MPASVSLTANGTAITVSVLATAQNGFSSNVQVAIAGLPTGVTAQPSSLTLTPGTAATLSLTAPAGTAAGSSTATLTGTSGALTHTASLPITVITPPPAQADFSLAVSPQSLSLIIGGMEKVGLARNVIRISPERQAERLREAQPDPSPQPLQEQAR